MAYTCPVCGMTSYNPNDEHERYCGACHKHEADMDPAGMLGPGPAFLTWLAQRTAVLHGRLLAPDHWAGITHQLTHHAIVDGRVGNKESLTGYWAYGTEDEAVAALNRWGEDGSIEPGGWLRPP